MNRCSDEKLADFFSISEQMGKAKGYYHRNLSNGKGHPIDINR